MKNVSLFLKSDIREIDKWEVKENLAAYAFIEGEMALGS